MNTGVLLVLLATALAASASEGRVPTSLWGGDWDPKLEEVLRRTVLEVTRHSLPEVLRTVKSKLETLIAESEISGAELIEELEMGKETKDGEGGSLVETIRRILREGIPSRNISSLDPLELGDFSYDKDKPEIGNVNFNANGMEIVGLADFISPSWKFKINWPKFTALVTINFVLPRLQLQGTYDAQADIGNGGLYIWGWGDFGLGFKGMDVTIGVEVGPTKLLPPGNPPMAVKSIDVTTKIEEVFVNFQNLFDHELLSQIVNEIIGEMITEYKLPQVEAAVDDFLDERAEKVRQAVNKEMDGMGFKDLREWINSLKNRTLPDEDDLPDLEITQVTA